MQRTAAALIVTVATALAVPAPAAAEGDGGAAKRLKQVESELDKGKAQAQEFDQKARQLAEDTQKLRHQMVDAAARIQGHERSVQELAAKVERLNALEKRKSAELASRRKQFAEVLMALQRIATFPPEALIARPMSPGDTVRSAVLLKSTVPAIEHKAVQLREEIRFVNETRDEAAKRQAELKGEREQLQTERKQMRILLARKEVLRRRAEAKSRAAEQRVETLAKEAGNLRDLLARLAERRKKAEQQRRREAEAVRKAHEARRAAGDKAPPTQTARAAPAAIPGGKPQDFPATPITKARGDLTVPVVGKLIGSYGERMHSGLTRKGLDFATPPKAQVVAPFAGQVVYAGKFRGYGLLLIIEHGEGYHSLMAGMDHIDASIGQWVLAGEPVGEMADSRGKNPILYLELRRDGQPVNPLPWLASLKDKANG